MESTLKTDVSEKVADGANKEVREKDEIEEIARAVMARVRPTRYFFEGLRVLESAETKDAVITFLHCIFDLSRQKGSFEEKQYDLVDVYRLLFFLADGWRDSRLLELPDDRGKKYELRNAEKRWVEVSPCEVRQQVARKAFEMLALNLFKMELRDSRERYRFDEDWVFIVPSERLLPEIMNFFRPIEPHRDIKICNLSYYGEKRSHHEESAIVFLLNLAEFIWEWQEINIHDYWESKAKERAESYNLRMRSRLTAAKPWMLEILEELSRLRDFFRKEERLVGLDKACLAKLEEIARRSELSECRHPVIKNRKVRNLEEARYVGSASAWLLLEYDLRIKERRRLESVLKATRQKQEAEEKLKRLGG